MPTSKDFVFPPLCARGRGEGGRALVPCFGKGGPLRTNTKQNKTKNKTTTTKTKLN